MLRLLLYALAPVALGSAVALVPGVSQRLFRPVHTFAFAAAVTIVLAELLPHAVIDAGPLALLVFAVAMAAPALLDRAVDRLRPGQEEHDGAGLELAFAGLLVHQAIDGLQIGASGAIDQGGSVVFAVAAHTFPLVAVAVLAYAHHDGRRVALFRAGALLVATALGVVAAGFGTASLGAVEPWVAAAVSGVLLFMLGHDLPAKPPPDWQGRAAELGVTLFGMTLPLAWMARSDHLGASPQVASGVTAALVAVLAVQVLWIAGFVPRRFPFAREEGH